MRRYQIVQRAAELRAILDVNCPKIRARRADCSFEFDASDTRPYIARAKWQLKHMPRGLTESAEVLGEIRGTLIGAGLYEEFELDVT